MESNYNHEDSINSSDDVDQELENVDVGVGRSYQCVFCKRGFTTAQALGGHMNIHRKDRAKTRPKQDDQHNIHTSPRYYQPIATFTPRFGAAQGAQIHYRTFFPASTSSTRDQNSLSSGYHQFMADDCHMSLSLQFGTAKFGENMEKKRVGGHEDGGLDLELRLGYDR